MATPKRILYIAGEVAPFANGSEAAGLVRTLPEKIQEAGGFEARITMPRYGTISERKNSLHEVIRLSGTEVPMGEGTETLTVKVASIPGLRLQVYFMDHDGYFGGRKGTFADESGAAYEDNAERALFFSRAVLETIQKLRWAPDVIHAFGWAGGLVPLLCKQEYAASDVFGETKVIYTPDAHDAEARLTPAFAERVGMDGLADTLAEVGLAHADAAIFPPSLAPTGGAKQFDADEDARTEQALALYERVLSEVPA